MAEQVRDGVDGLLFSPADVASLAGAMQRLVTDRPLFERLRQNLPRVTTIEESAAALEASFRQLLASRAEGTEDVGIRSRA
jgi:glycosyltransferase involved in cell wall biosynthesis